MKNYSLISAMALLFIASSAFCQNFSLAYDASGNRINRTITLLKSTMVDNMDTLMYQRYTEKLNEVTVNLFPNPVSTSLTIEVSEYDFNTKSFILLFDNSGRLINRTGPLSETNHIDFSRLPPGNYLIKIVIGEYISDWNIINQ